MIDLVPGAAGPSSAGGVDHVCLSIDCDDLEGVVRELRARGVTIEGEISDRRGGYGGGAAIYMRDPGGYKIELRPPLEARGCFLRRCEAQCLGPTPNPQSSPLP